MAKNGNVISGDNMKKIILMVIGICMLVGCSLGNTPTARVEDFLSKYQMLDEKIVIDYTDLVDDVGVDQDVKTRYEEVIKDQYRNMSYEVKEEEIDGDEAEVTVQIEVMDYKTILDKYDSSDYSRDEYHDKVLDELEDAKEKITYTIEFTLSKDSDDNWVVNELTTEDKEKLLGIN